MKVWAHRGASGYAPENTMEAFKMAIDMKADGIETDVHLTKDGVCVLMHDEKLDRTSNMTGYIKDYNYDELKDANCNYHMEGYEFCHLPTLKELLELVKEHGTYLNIEIKTDFFLYEGIEQKVLELVREVGVESQVIYSSFNHYSLMKLRELDPSVDIGLLYMSGLYKVWDYACGLKANALHPYLPVTQMDDYVKNAHLHHLKVHPWTVNQKEHMILLKKMNVDAIITNYPDVGLQIAKGEEHEIR